ncbi:peptidoglycan-binding protein [Streptomyces sp. HUCO-GS316]|uniref:peptidoglycan-binding protein n=1 Tax=Streptomyces sp. HUCO-GS316 TaxID=2692198 RepID=UPI00136BDA7A|nr:peptidoglycan-binding protein [Streptomyces sp. HUCO-GS316]
MPTPPDRERPQDGPALEPIRVLRPRRTDALAELFREFEQGTGAYEPVPLPRPAPGAAEAETQELPPFTAHHRHPPSHSRRGSVLGRTAAVTTVAAAALAGFGCALLLPDRSDASVAPAPTAAASTAPTSASTSAAGGPDGSGTLREGDSGPEVTELQQRLLSVPNVYENGSASGRYDAVLTEAVARFQLWYGIRGDEDGVYGDDTRLMLESRTAQGYR